MAKTDATELLLSEAARAVHETDPSAFLVPSRVVRRVIRHEREITGFGMQVPHRKSYVVAAENLLRLVDREELGIDRASEVRSPAILIAQPGEEKLVGMTMPNLLLRCWSFLFHARIDAEMLELSRKGKLLPSLIRQRIDQIGQVEFDEMHSVIKQEEYLLPPEDPLSIYSEAAAVYLEMRHFQPQWLPSYFPALDDYARIDAVFGQDVDVEKIFEATRPKGAALPDDRPTPRSSKKPPEEAPAIPGTAVVSPSAIAELTPKHEKTYAKLIRKADKASEGGNSVRAAVLRMHASQFVPAPQSSETAVAAVAELENLANRLQDALGFDDDEAAGWREALTGLLDNTMSGFWSADKRLLYDLQKVCVDHEREISKVDLVSWTLSLGKKPIKRPLPNQREVLISKHLRRARSRLTSAKLAGHERERLAELLDEAAHLAEVQLRGRLRPLIAQALDEVGLEPHNLPERVARKKVIEELLDAIVHHGFVNMSMLRDAISRNMLKLPDLSGPGEWWKGDWLLAADKKLNVLLDGVYRRGEFYLRWLQRASSVAFGTTPGRFCTQYIAIPFGGAAVILEGLKHLFDRIYGIEHHVPPVLGGAAMYHGVSQKLSEAAGTATAASAVEHPSHFLSWFDYYHPAQFIAGILVLGLFLLGMIHIPQFRRAVWTGVKTAGRFVYDIAIRLPRWLWKMTFIRELLRSQGVRMFRKYVLYPAIFTLLLCVVLPKFGVYAPPETAWAVLIFLLLAFAINSRAGRDIEERTSERLHLIWHRIRARVFVALFETVVNFFKRVLETFERVMYAVDEWLRFKSGENFVTLIVKGLLGMAWAAVAFVVRFYVTLLIEPQVNPIKHFPVVTVSHKFILPLSIPITNAIATPLIPLIGTEFAYAIAVPTMFLLPGVFGFLVWECKENWKLYAENRREKVKPVLVGSHGESMIRLMKPGFHSGTVPKIFAKLRKAERTVSHHRRIRHLDKYREKLHHTVHDVKHFVERELTNLLNESRAFADSPASVGKIRVASNSITVELKCPAVGGHSMWLAFQEQSGWLMTRITNTGWADELNAEQFAALQLAMKGFYKMSGVDIIREQLPMCFNGPLPPYDVMDRGLVLWPGGEYEVEVCYDLNSRPELKPKPKATALNYNLPEIDAKQAVFSDVSLPWQSWVSSWQEEQEAKAIPQLFPHQIQVVPDTRA